MLGKAQAGDGGRVGLGVRLGEATSNASTDPKCSSGLAEDNKTFLELFLPHSANLAADSKKWGFFKRLSTN